MEINTESEAPNGWRWNKLLNYFFQGLIILAPIIVTIWAVYSLFAAIDNILPNILHAIFPNSWMPDAEGNLRNVPGLGFIIVIIFVLIIGWISSSFIVSRMVSLLSRVLEKTPGIRLIYSSVKDFIEAFAGNKRKFDIPVLVNVDGPDVWRMGFMTQKDCHQFGLVTHSAIYVPHSYALSGIVYIVPSEKIKILENTRPADAMKFAVSGGISDVADQ